MNSLFGLPAHPLIVHAPVVLLPLAAIGVFVTLAKPAWYFRYRWALLIVGLMGAFGAILAASSGEGFEEQVERGSNQTARVLIHDHAESGELARTVAIVFAVVLIGYVVLPWLLARRAGVEEDGPQPAGPSWLRPVLMVAVAIAAIGSTITIIDAGHSGAESVWNDDEPVETGG